jgi:hypothetical protein
MPLSALGNAVSADTRRWRHVAAQTAVEWAWAALAPVGTGLAIFPVNTSPHLPRSTAMKFETVMVNSLFCACLVICISTLGSMVL